MAASTLTIDTGEWIYLDSSGTPHTVTNGQTFSMTVVDGGVAAVEYAIPSTGQSVTTTDGLTLHIRSVVSGDNVAKTIHYLTDAGQGSAFHNRSGEFVIEDPTNGTKQIWHVAIITPSDADFASAGTITMTLEDQFGNVMVMPATGSGIDVGQAA